MNILRSKFLRSQSGAFLPMFAIGTMVLIPMIGMSIDYTRLLSFKGKLQSAADSAVAASLMDARNAKKAEKTANSFLAANLPDVDFESRRVVSDGKIVFQVRSEIETPVLAMIGKPKFTVYVSTDMPNMIQNDQGGVSTRAYSERDIRQMKRNVSNALDKLPRNQREAYRKEYEAFFSRIGKNGKSMTGTSN